MPHQEKTQKIPSLKDVLQEESILLEKPQRTLETPSEKVQNVFQEKDFFKEAPSLRNVLFDPTFRLAEPELPEEKPLEAKVPEERGFFGSLVEIPKEFGKGIVRGIDETQAMLFGALAIMGDALDLENIERLGIEGYLRNIKEAEKNAAKVASLSNINSIGDFVLWAASGLGSLAPTMALSLGSGIAAQTLGRAAVKRMLKRQVGKKVAEKLMKKTAQRQIAKIGKKELTREVTEELVKSGVKRELAERAVKRAINMPITARNIGILFGSGLPQAGDIYMEIFESTGEKAPATAIVSGLAAGALDILPLGRFLNKFGGRFKSDEAARSWLRRVAKEAGIQSVLEGSTEGAQEIIAIVAQSIKANPGDIEKKTRAVVEDLKKNKERILNAMALGALAGSVMGSLEVASRSVAKPKEAKPSQQPEEEISDIDAAIERAIQEQEAVEMGVLTPEDELEEIRRAREELPEEELAQQQREALRRRLEDEERTPPIEVVEEAGIPVEEGVIEDVPIEELLEPRLPRNVAARTKELRGKITQLEAKQEKALQNPRLSEKERAGIVQELEGRIERLNLEIERLIEPYRDETALPEAERRTVPAREITLELTVEVPSLVDVVRGEGLKELEGAGRALEEIEGGREEFERAKVKPVERPEKKRARERALPGKEVKALPAPRRKKQISKEIKSLKEDIQEREKAEEDIFKELPEKRPWELTRDEYAKFEDAELEKTFMKIRDDIQKSLELDKAVGADPYASLARLKTLEKLKERKYREHKRAVKQAILEGKNVPEKVLEDYPDLKRLAQKKGLIKKKEKPKRATKPKIAAVDFKRFGIKIKEADVEKVSKALDALLSRFKKLRSQITDESGNIKQDISKDIIERYINLEKAIENRLKKLNAEFDAAKINGFVKKTPEGWLATSLYSHEQMIFDNVEDAIAFTRGEGKVDPKKVNYKEFERAASIINDVVKVTPMKYLASVAEKRLKDAGIHPFIIRRMVSAVIRRTKPEETGRQVIFARAVEPETKREKAAAEVLAKLNHLRRQAQADYDVAREELLDLLLKTGNEAFLQADDVGNYKFKQMEGLDKLPESVRSKARLALIDYIASQGIEVLPAVGRRLEIAVTPKVEPKGKPLPKSAPPREIFVEVAKRFERFTKLDKAEKQLKRSEKIKEIFHNGYLRAFAAGRVYPPIRTKYGAFIVRQSQTNLDKIDILKQKRAEFLKQIAEEQGVKPEKGDPYVVIKKVKRIPKDALPEKATPKQVKEIADAIAETEKEIKETINFSIASRPESNTPKAGRYKKLAEEIEKEFGLNVKVVSRPSDLPFEAPPTTQGAAVGDSIFLVEQNIPTEKEARKVLLEEAVGHIGIEKLMGKDFDRLLDIIIRQRPEDINRYIVEYADVLKIRGLDPASREAKRIAAQEVIAKLAREEPNLSLTKRIIAEVRAWLRKMFPNIQFTDDDIRAILMKAADNLRHQKADPYKTVPVVHVNPNSAKFDIKRFKPVNVKSDAFRKWFGDSKITDENGKPLVVYHGTVSDFTVFKPRQMLPAAVDQFMGIHFAKDYRVANRFAEGLYRGGWEGGNVIPVYLNLKPRKISGPIDTLAIAKDVIETVIEKRKDAFVEWATGRYDIERVGKEKGLTKEEAGILYDWFTHKIDELPDSIEKKFDLEGFEGIQLNMLYEFEEKGGERKEIATFVTDVDPGLMVNEFNVEHRRKIVSKYIEELAKQGYNGIEYKITVSSEIPEGADNTAYIVFHPEQIKSAISNTGEFDPSNPDIRYAIGNHINPAYNADLFIEYGRDIKETIETLENKAVAEDIKILGNILEEITGSDEPSETRLNQYQNTLRQRFLALRKEPAKYKTSQADKKKLKAILNRFNGNADHPFAKRIGNIITAISNNNINKANAELSLLATDIDSLLEEIKGNRIPPRVSFSLSTLDDKTFTKLAKLGHKLYRSGLDFDTWNKRMAQALGNSYTYLEPFMNNIFEVIKRKDYKPGMPVFMRATASVPPQAVPQLPPNPNAPASGTAPESPIRQKRYRRAEKLYDSVFETMVNVVEKQNAAGEEFGRKLRHAIGLLDELAGRSANVIVETEKALRNPLRHDVREAISEIIDPVTPFENEPRAIFTRAALAVNALADKTLAEAESMLQTEGAKLWLRTYNQILENLGVRKGYVNVLTPEAREIISKGEGDRYQTIIEVLQNITGLNKQQVQRLLSRVNQREGILTERVTNVPTHIKVGDEIIPFLESHPFGALEAANIGLAKQVALINTFGEGDTIKERIQSMIQEIDRLRSEFIKQGGNSEHFNNAMNSYLGKPLKQVYVDPRSLAKRFFKNVVLPVESEMLLSLSGFVQLPQTIIAVPQNVGVKNYIKGLIKFVANTNETIERLRYIGAISTDILDLWSTPGAFLEDFGKFIKQVGSRATLRKWFIELNDIIASSAFEEFAKSIQEKVESGQPLSENDKKTLRFLEFKDDEIRLFESGDGRTKEGGFLFNEVIRRGRKMTQGTGLRGPEKTRAVASPVFSAVFQFQNYMILQTQIAKKFFIKDFKESLKQWKETGDLKPLLKAFDRAAKLLVGGALAGELSILLRSLLKDRPIDRDDEDFIERIFRDWGESLVFGPVQRIYDAYEFSNSVEQAIFTFSPIGNFTLNMGKMLVGQTPYNDLTMVERVAKFIRYHTPIAETMRAGLTMVGIAAKEDKELRAALSRLYKWKRKHGFIEKGKQTSLVGYLESRRQIKKAIKAVRRGESPKEALRKAIIEKYKELVEKAKKGDLPPKKATLKEAKRLVILSIKNKRPFRGIPDEKLPQLRNDLGDETFKILAAYDEILRIYADVLK